MGIICSSQSRLLFNANVKVKVEAAMSDAIWFCKQFSYWSPYSGKTELN